MSSSKRMNLICVIAMVLCLAASVLLPQSGAETPIVMGYEDRLFDTSRVHTIDISMSDWDQFIDTCENEEYAACDVTVDGEKFKNVAIRAKGNTSLSSVSSMNSERYSFKLEFDHYDDAFSYHGLDKLSLNNLIQDNTFMKDYLAYRMMNEFGAVAPLTSFVYITVNGEDWGLYLAVEGVEDAFLLRNYGTDHGELYKPDSLSFGGGRGNGMDFDFDSIRDQLSGGSEGEEKGFDFSQMMPGGGGFDFTQMMPGGGDFDFSSFAPGSSDEQKGEMPGGRGGFSFGGMGSSDVKLQYIDDDFDSYSNIFNNAKTVVNDQDKTRLISALKALSEGDVSSVDVESVMRYFVVHNYTVNDDSYTGMMIHNYYLYEKNGVMSMIPWDYNLGFGTFSGGNASSSVNKDIDNPVNGSVSDRPMLSWIFSDEEYTQKYHELFAEFLQTVDPAAIIDEAYRLIAPYVQKDPTKFCTEEEFEKGVSALRSFVTLRSQSIENQLSGVKTNVNTAGLNLSDMGTMSSGGMGMGMPEMPTGGFTMPDMTNGSFDMSSMPSGGFTAPGGDAQNDAQTGSMPTGGFTMPDMTNGSFDMSSMPSGGFTAPGSDAQNDAQTGSMPSGNMGGMPSGDFQMPFGSMDEMPSGDFQVPFGNMGEMPSGGFTMPGMPSQSAETPVNPEPTQMPVSASELSAEETDDAENMEEKMQAPETDEKANAEQTADNSISSGRDRANPSQRNGGENRPNDFSFSGMPGANAGAQNTSSSVTLLIASIIVLIVSIAIALIIKH